ncbi:MAG: hypothetical protein GX640_21870, partial [Fibrobacter sp.]|nr:hypothetical protein [Fibrobacter sp.]
ENRKKIENAMRIGLEADPTATAFTGLSKFGLMEITRKRVRPELQEFFTNVCPACGGLGWVFSAETVTARIDRDLRRATISTPDVTIAVHPAVAAFLRKDNETMKKLLEREHKCKLIIEEDEELDQDEYSFSSPDIHVEKEY